MLDTTGANDALACVFAGTSRSGGEYASNSTAINIKETARRQLAFDVTRTTTSERHVLGQDALASKARARRTCIERLR